MSALRGAFYNTFKHKVAKKTVLLMLVLFGLIESAVLAGFFERSEARLYDTWFRLRGALNPGEQIVIVAIDEESINRIGPLPWPRSIHARLLDRLQQARAVGFDIVFAGSTTVQNDKALADAVEKHGRVILAGEFAFEKGKAGQTLQYFTGPETSIAARGAAVGFANVPTELDGVVRRITLADVNSKAPFPAFGLAVALSSIERNPAIEVQPGLISAGGSEIPIDGLNRAMPEFWGPGGTFETVRYADVLDGQIEANAFRNKIVLVGATAASLHDQKPTPFTTTNLILSGNIPTPGVEIHASVVNSYLQDRWYRKSSLPESFSLLLVAGLTAAIGVRKRGPWTGLALTIMLMAVILGLAYYYWLFSRVWINAVAPLTLIVIVYVSMTAAGFIEAEMARRKTKAMLCRYVSPDVAEKLMSDPKSLALGGQRQQVTVMFCDIRGFTNYSENKDPERVVNRLNEYLSAMTKVIFGNGGTLDKYLGDGLMAVFGAPYYYDDHATRAVQAALEIQVQVDKLNEAWKARNEPPLTIGVGINSGTVLVGNVGSEDRMDYTVMGENVNLAARMEGLTKSFQTTIIISARSVALIPAETELPWYFENLGAVEVKGFTVPVVVYTVNSDNACRVQKLEGAGLHEPV